MRLLNLNNGELQVYSQLVRGSRLYRIYFRRNNGHYAMWTAQSESRLKEIIKAWCNIKYLYK